MRGRRSGPLPFHLSVNRTRRATFVCPTLSNKREWRRLELSLFTDLLRSLTRTQKTSLDRLVDMAAGRSFFDDHGVLLLFEFCTSGDDVISLLLHGNRFQVDTFRARDANEVMRGQCSFHTGLRRGFERTDGSGVGKLHPGKSRFVRSIVVDVLAGGFDRLRCFDDLDEVLRRSVFVDDGKHDLCVHTAVHSDRGHRRSTRTDPWQRAVMLQTRGKIPNGVPRRRAFGKHLIIVAKKILRVVVLIVDQLIVLQTVDR